jgi:hypothetical protein
MTPPTFLESGGASGHSRGSSANTSKVSELVSDLGSSVEARDGADSNDGCGAGSAEEVTERATVVVVTADTGGTSG